MGLLLQGLGPVAQMETLQHMGSAPSSYHPPATPVGETRARAARIKGGTPLGGNLGTLGKADQGNIGKG